jgi:hypothetical protein
LKSGLERRRLTTSGGVLGFPVELNVAIDFCPGAEPLTWSLLKSELSMEA